MINDIKTNEGFVCAFIEWNIVDENTWMCDDGKYVKIGYCWIHPLYRLKGVLGILVEKILEDERIRNCEYVLYRHDKSGKVRQTTIRKFLRITKYRDLIKSKESPDGERQIQNKSGTKS